MNRLLAIAWKELLQLRRDRMTLGMMLGIPILQLLLFGYAINTDVRHSPTVVFDEDQTAASRDAAARLQATGFFDLVGEVRGYPEIERALRAGDAKAALVVPAGYHRALLRGDAQLQLVVDGSDPQVVASTTAAATGISAGRSAIHVEPAVLYNPDQRTATYVVPGLIGVILTMTMVMLTAMAIARERERGTLEQLIVSPIRRGELILGKIVPYVSIGYVQITVILIVGWLVFDVPVVGSLGLLCALAAIFIAANLALGLFFSTVARTQQQAMQMSFFFLLPNILLSGFMFPWEAMPRPAQLIAQALPLTHFLRVVRGIALKGAGAGALWPEVAWMAAIFGLLVVVASLRFRKKLV